MTYTVEKTEKNELKLSMKLTGEEWHNANLKAYDKNKKKYAVPGFRKGHVPYSYFVKYYGEQPLFEDALNFSFTEKYYEVLAKEKDYKVIDGPSIEDFKFEEDGGVTIVAVAPLKPEVELGKYKGIKIEKVEYNVTDADIDAEVEKLRERNSREIEVTDRPVQDGDICDLDYSGSVDNVKFEGGTAEHQRLVIGSKTFIPGFEDQIIGMTIGSERDITVKFPDDYSAEQLAGKVAVFAIKLHGIKVKELPEVDDEFIKDATGEESLEAYKAKRKEEMTKANQEKGKRETEDKLVKMIVEDSKVDVPDCLVENAIDSMVEEMSYRMMYSGLKMEDYLKYTNQTMEEYRKGFTDAAKERVKSQLIVEKIIEVENIKATEEEVNAKIAEQATSVEKSFEEYKAAMPARQLEYIQQSIVIDKLFEFLMKNNEVA